MGKKNAPPQPLTYEKLLAHIQTQQLTELDFDAILSPKYRDYSQVKHEATLAGHKDKITALTAFPTGRLASGGYNGTIKLWDPQTGSCLNTLSGCGKVHVMAALPNGRLASGGHKEIQLWDLQAGSCLNTLRGHSAAIRALALLPDGHLASGSEDNTIKFWDLKTGRCINTLSGHKSVQALAMLPNGHLASGGGDNEIKIWDPVTRRCLSTLKNRVLALAALPDGRLATGSHDDDYDTSIKLWDPQTGRCLNVLSGSGGSVMDFGVLPSGHLASVNYRGTIKIWDPTTGHCLNTLTERFGGAMAVLPDGRLASGGMQQTIKIWSAPPMITPDKIEKIKSALTANRTIKALTRNKTTEKSNVKELPNSKLEILNELQQLREQLEQEKKARMAAEERLTIPPSTSSYPSSSIHIEATYIKAKELHIGKLLGTGGFGTVYVGTWQYTTVAVKEINGNYTQGAVYEFRKEAAIMQRLQSPQVIRLFGISGQPPKYQMVMEYAPKGSLYRLLHSDEPLSWPQRYQIGLDIALGLHFMHTQKPPILHRDLKSHNVLMMHDYRAKLADFGLSKVKSETATQSRGEDTKSKETGTLAWMAPEQFDPKGKVTKATDIYSFGMVLWELATRQLPFSNTQNAQILMLWIMAGKHPDIPKACQPEYRDVIETCWKQKPDERATAKLLVKSLSKLLINNPSQQNDPKSPEQFKRLTS